MTDKTNHMKTMLEGMEEFNGKMGKLLVSPYALRQGITLFSRVINRYDPDFIITKDEVIIAVVEVMRAEIVDEGVYLRLANTARIFSCAFGVIYCHDTEDLIVLDVREEKSKDAPYILMHTFDAFKAVLYNNTSKIPTQGEWKNAIQHIIDETKDKRYTDAGMKALEVLQKTHVEYDQVTKRCWVEDKNDEHDFFKTILKSYEEENICRYTTYGSLERILREKKQSVCSIVCMNDETECYYADDYLTNHRDEKVKDALLINYEELNDCQISSCTDIKMADNLSMWRMYGDDAKGVCLKFKVRKNLLDARHFYLYHVSYADEDNKHKELDLIAGLKDLKIGEYSFEFKTWYIWKHFFKPVYYKDEKEVRLLYFKQPEDQLKWIKAGTIMAPVIEFNIEQAKNEYPLVLSEIKLGPKFPEAKTNAVQIGYWKQMQGIEEEDSCLVVQSKIQGYR